MKYLLKPNGIVLTIYGIISFVCLLFFFWKISFIWGFLIDISEILISLLIIIIFALATSIMADIKYKCKTKKYFIISLIQLLVVWIASDPVRSWQIDSSLEKSHSIINALDEYKAKFDCYPESLDVLEDELNVDLPARTNLGTKYLYEQNGTGDYRLKFYSYYGYTAFYNIKGDKWLFKD